jgi:hypothetical protein
VDAICFVLFPVVPPDVHVGLFLQKDIFFSSLSHHPQALAPIYSAAIFSNAIYRRFAPIYSPFRGDLQAAGFLLIITLPHAIMCQELFHYDIFKM